MIRIQVEIKGTSPYLQHRFSEQAEVSGAKGTRRVNIAEETRREAAERVCYRDKEGYLYHPSAGVARLLREAGSAHKQKGSRKSVKWIVPAAVRMATDTLAVYDGEGERAIEFEVDSRPVTIPATKGRIMRHRPRLDSWAMRFQLVINEDVLSAEVIHQLLVEGGQQIGLGDFRPEKGGPFGTFQVVLWEEVGATRSRKKAKAGAA